MLRGNCYFWTLAGVGVVLLLFSGSSASEPCSPSDFIFKNCSEFNNDVSGSPVCGSDKRTYPNQAFLDCVNFNRNSSVTVSFNGSCNNPCWVSTNEFMTCLPVCASNGQTFPSKAALECLSLYWQVLNQTTTPPFTLAYVGKCCDPNARTVNASEIAIATPNNTVCGNDGQNYRNIWELMLAATVKMGLKISYPGECRLSCPYSPFYNPVCGSDGKTYANLHALACHRQLYPFEDLTPHYMGVCCPDPNNPPSPCSMDPCLEPLSPVCADNGITYHNSKVVDCLRFNGAKIRILHSGGCSLSEVKRAIKTKCDACTISYNVPEWNPVCGMNNVTFSSPAAMLCKYPRMTILYEGICGVPAYSSCYSALNKPSNEVCGNDGRTYRNEDALLCAKKDDPNLKLKAYGHCGIQDDPCLYRGEPHITDNGRPVCASDGITYITPQALWCARKACPDLRFLHNGMCFPSKKSGKNHHYSNKKMY